MSNDSNQGKKPVIRAQRRRPAQSDNENRERAESPRREKREQQSGFKSSTSGTGNTGSGGSGGPAGLPFKFSKRTLLIIAVLIVLSIFLKGGSDIDQGNNLESVPTDAPQGVLPAVTESSSKPFVAPPRQAGAEEQTWLVMLYMDADDKVLEHDIYVDLNEAEKIGSSDRVQIVAQVDRFSAGYSGDGDWSTTKRFYVQQDDDLTRVGSTLVKDMGEVDMSDRDTLIDFVTWAVQNYPADKHVLILSDHGMGWPGGWSDPVPATPTDSSTPLSSALGNMMYLNNIDDALQTIRERTGLEKIEVIGMDACLMGQAEVLAALAPHANYAVVSEETEPALGWAYASFLQSLEKDPGMTGAELGNMIVDSYIHQDQRIVDDQARAELMRQGSPMGGLLGRGSVPSSSQVASKMSKDITLTVVDLESVPELMQSINDLSFALQTADQKEVARARNYAQSFTSVFGQQVPASYIDLGSFVQLLKQTDAGVNAEADKVLAAIQQAVVAEKHGTGKPGATGISIYFPNSQLYQSPMAGPQSYTIIANRFARYSTWDDFLTFHYTGKKFDASAQQATLPEPGAGVKAPGAGEIKLTPIQLSDTVASPGRGVVLSTDISGGNLGYAFIFAGYHDLQSNSIFIADTDYLDSGQTREVNGIYYPVWPEGEFTLEFEWEPLMFAVSNGTDSVTALLTPMDFGATSEEATYAVDGIYTFASGEALTARLYFSDGLLRQVFTFTGNSTAGAPREVYPQTGDSFTVLEQWLDLDAQGRVIQQATEVGETLIFSDQMFSYKEQDAAVGEYIVGLIAEDLDGKRTNMYTTVNVE